MIIDDAIYEGNTHKGGEIGHLAVVPEGGELCYCGMRGCFDTVCRAGKLAGYGADIQTPGPFRPYSTAFDRRTGPTGGENLLQNTKFFVHRRLGSPSLFSALR